MHLRAFIGSLPPESREPFAARCETTIGHLRNVAGGHKSCSPILAACIERQSAGVVRRWDLRPDDWHRVWPELVGVEGAPPVPAESKEVA